MKTLKLLSAVLSIIGLTIPVIAARPGMVATPLSPKLNQVQQSQQLAVSFLPDGTIQLRFGANPVGWGIPFLQGYTPTSTSAVTLTSTHGRITQNYASNKIAVTYDCMLSGTDLTISATITNSAKQAIGGVTVVTPSFTFSTTPTGTMPSWHVSYLAAQGMQLFHPSYQSPLGCVYAGNAAYAVAAWSPSELSRQSLIQASWISDNALPNPLPIELHTVNSINAGASETISIVLRVTTNQTPAGILSGYKALLPAMSYTPVAKPVVAFQAIDASWVTPTDPYGYDGDQRRLDLTQGVQAYLQMVKPILNSSRSYAVIFWAPGGYQTTTMYPIDFDVNLNRLTATWPTLVSGLRASNYRVGICARFGDALNADGGARRADPTNPADVKAMLARVDAAAKAGVDVWYVDSACNDWPSTQMTALAKKHLAANHLFYTEYATDVSMAFAGVYCEWNGTRTAWLTEQQRAQLNELYPKSNWICVDRSGHTNAAQLTALGFQPLYAD